MTSGCAGLVAKPGASSQIAPHGWESSEDCSRGWLAVPALICPGNID